MKVGVLHPGAMGSALAAQMQGDVWWVSSGRSEASASRADACGLVDAGSLDDLVARCDLIFSVCPPAAARQVARSVQESGFGGVFVDANAIAPSTAREIGTGFADFVDGGIVGPPPSDDVECRLYLSGESAQEVAALFSTSQVETVVLGRAPGAASALKAAYAGWTKGSTALLLAVTAFSRAEGVDEALVEEWGKSIPELPARVESVAARVGTKAWRFAGEMEEIAAAYAEEGLPSGFHEAAADIYRHLSELKDGTGDQTIEAVVDLILEPDRP